MQTGQYKRNHMIGKQFGALHVIEVTRTSVTPSNTRRYYFRMGCSCGNTDYVISETNLARLQDKRCPVCRYGSDPAIDTHPLKHVWHGMHDRCYRSDSQAYKYYGARGISICDAWRKVSGDTVATRKAFFTFVADMGPRPEGMSIDRVDVDGDYKPGNCRWATDIEQAQNKRVSPTVELERKLGLATGQITAMAKKYGMPVEVAVKALADATPGKRVSWQKIFGVTRKTTVRSPNPSGRPSRAMAKFLEYWEK